MQMFPLLAAGSFITCMLRLVGYAAAVCNMQHLQGSAQLFLLISCVLRLVTVQTFERNEPQRVCDIRHLPCVPPGVDQQQEGSLPGGGSSYQM
jgi:hypothetical protein